MLCPNCGNYVAEGTSFCTSCGTRLEAPSNPNPDPTPNPYGQSNPYGQTNPNPYGQTNPYGQNNPYGNPYGTNPNMKPTQPYQGFAIASLVLGILSFFCFGIIAGGLAIVFATIAKNNGNKSGMATAGLVCGIIGVVLTLIGLNAMF